MVSALLEAGGDDSIRLKDDAGVTVLKLTKAKLKQDRATWDEIPKSEREGDFPDRFPSMLRFIQKPKKEKKPKKARVSRHDIAAIWVAFFSCGSDLVADRWRRIGRRSRPSARRCSGSPMSCAASEGGYLKGGA